MVQELQAVLSKVETLKEEEQRMIAKLLEQEIAWENTLKESQDFLSNLADEALQMHNNGKTIQSDW